MNLLFIVFTYACRHSFHFIRLTSFYTHTLPIPSCPNTAMLSTPYLAPHFITSLPQRCFSLHSCSRLFSPAPAPPLSPCLSLCPSVSVSSTSFEIGLLIKMILYSFDYMHLCHHGCWLSIPRKDLSWFLFFVFFSFIEWMKTKSY